MTPNMTIPFILRNGACKPLQTLDEYIAKQNKDNKF